MMTSQYQDIKLLSPYEQFLKNTASNTNGCDSGGVNTSGGCRKEVKILGKKLGTGIITSTEEGNVVEVIEEKTKLVWDPTITFSIRQLSSFLFYNIHQNFVGKFRIFRYRSSSKSSNSSIIFLELELESFWEIKFVFYILDDGRSRSLQPHWQHGDLISASRQADHGEWRAGQLLAPSKEIRVRLRLIDRWNRESFPRSMQACSPCDSDFLNFENRLKDTSPAGHFERTQKDSRDSFSSTSGLPDLDWTKKSGTVQLCSTLLLGSPPLKLSKLATSGKGKREKKGKKGEGGKKEKKKKRKRKCRHEIFKWLWRMDVIIIIDICATRKLTSRCCSFVEFVLTTHSRESSSKN